MQGFINERQTSDFRKFKYAALRAVGYHKANAVRMRDWNVCGVIRKIAKATKQEYALAHYDFYTQLAEKGIKMWRDVIPDSPVELSPEEDRPPEEEQEDDPDN